MRGVWIGCLAAVIASLLYGIFRLERWEFASLDARLLWRQENRLRDSDIQTLVVAIDDKTLGMMPNRRWPFPRSEYARLVKVLKDAGSRCLGFDLRFEDSDPPEDQQLAAALRAAGNVYLGVRFDPQSSIFPGPMEIGDALDASLIATDPEGSARIKLKMESAALLPEVLAGLYTNTPAVLALAASLIPIAGPFQVFDGVQVVSIGVLRGTGDTRTPMIVALLGFWFVGMPVSLLLGFPAGLGPQGLWWGFVAGLAAVATFLLLRVRSRLAGEIARLDLDAEPARTDAA